MCTCFSKLCRTHLLRRKLLAELVEDEKVAVEIARLEEEFRRLTEENRTLVTVHNERAQQLESLCLTDRTKQDSSWPLTSAEPETSETSSWRQTKIKAHSAQQQPVNQLITQKGAMFVQAWVICSNHRRTVVIVVRLLYRFYWALTHRPLFWVLFGYSMILQSLPATPHGTLFTQCQLLSMWSVSGPVETQIFHLRSAEEFKDDVVQMLCVCVPAPSLSHPQHLPVKVPVMIIKQKMEMRCLRQRQATGELRAICEIILFTISIC